MKKYKQTVFGDGSDGTEPGNCFATCIAALLELPQEQVPNFVASDDNWWADVQDFLLPHGYSLILVDDGHEENYFFHTGYCIATGPGPRGPPRRHRSGLNRHACQPVLTIPLGSGELPGSPVAFEHDRGGRQRESGRSPGSRPGRARS
jgi:hypothetical protein